MTAIIRVGPYEATVENWHWSSENQALADMLNAMLDPAGPAGSDPNPDLTAAQTAVAQHGAELLSFEELPYDRERVY